MKYRLILTIAACTIASCDSDFFGGVCTLIGCNSGVIVVLESPPATPYRIEVYSGSAAGPRYAHSCAGASACGEVFFPDFTPFRFFVEVITTDTVRYEVAPTYTESRPNGPRCDPLCRNARVRLPTDRLGP